MSENKTQPTGVSVVEFIEALEHPVRKSDALQLLKIMNEITGIKAKMWGPSIIGWGDYHYKYDSGREGDFFRVGFSPRKANLSVYIMSDFPEYKTLLSKLGKYKLSKACLYINKLKDVDEEILRQIISLSFEKMNEKYPE